MLKKSIKLSSCVFIYTFLIACFNLNTTDASTITFTANPTTGYPSNTKFESREPSSGLLTTLQTTAEEGVNYYYKPPEINDDCKDIKITNIKISSYASGDAQPNSFDLAGITLSVLSSDLSQMYEIKNIYEGSKFNGPYIMALAPSLSNQVVRGISNPGFTPNPSPLPGIISFDIQIDPLSISEYQDLVIRVQHDMLDGMSGYVTSLSSTQPNVTLETDYSLCQEEESGYIPDILPPKTGFIKQNFMFISVFIALLIIPTIFIMKKFK